MTWLNLPGLMIAALLLGLRLALLLRNGRADPWLRYGEGRSYRLSEIIRYLCLALLALRPGLLGFGLLGPSAPVVWVSLTLPLTFAYCVLWVLFLRGGTAELGLAMDWLLAAVFLASGILWLSIPLMALGPAFLWARLRAARPGHPAQA